MPNLKRIYGQSREDLYFGKVISVIMITMAFLQQDFLMFEFALDTIIILSH